MFNNKTTPPVNRLLVDVTNEQDPFFVGTTTKQGKGLLSLIFSCFTKMPSTVSKVGDDFTVKGNGRSIETFDKQTWREANKK